MKPGRIILIRHGESAGNVDPDHYSRCPDHRIDLTAEGVRQAEEAGRELRRLVADETVQFYFSPYLRSRKTLENILLSFPNERRGGAHEEPRMREQEWGQLTRPDAMERYRRERESYGRFYFRMPNGESGADVFDRVSTFLETLHRAFEKPAFPKNVVIVTHGITMRLFLMRWYHWTVDHFETLEDPSNCHYVVMVRGEDGRYALSPPDADFPRMFRYDEPARQDLRGRV
jgi:broad specificity phosphatase PhoE